jgi:hypothetical protein
MRGALLMAGRKRRDERPIPAHPYRDTAVLYGVLSTALVVFASLTGGDVIRAGLVGAVFFVVATAWSWWRFRARIATRDTTARATAEDADPGSADETGGA